MSSNILTVGEKCPRAPGRYDFALLSPPRDGASSAATGQRGERRAARRRAELPSRSMGTEYLPYRLRVFEVQYVFACVMWSLQHLGYPCTSSYSIDLFRSWTCIMYIGICFPADVSVNTENGYRDLVPRSWSDRLENQRSNHCCLLTVRSSENIDQTSHSGERSTQIRERRC